MSTALLLLLAAPVPEALAARVEVACSAVAQAIDGGAAPALRVEQARTIEEFVSASGRARFEAAAWVRGTMWLQAPAILDRLPHLDGVLMHECAHATLRARGVPPLEPSLEEAVALELSGQAAKLPPAAPIAEAERASVDATLARPPSRAALEAALARAVATHGADVRRWAREGALVPRLITASGARRSGSERRSPSAPSPSGSAPRPPR